MAFGAKTVRAGIDGLLLAGVQDSYGIIVGRDGLAYRYYDVKKGLGVGIRHTMPSTGEEVFACGTAPSPAQSAVASRAQPWYSHLDGPGDPNVTIFLGGVQDSSLCMTPELFPDSFPLHMR